jgi:PadR family transcriptional regulator AphA
MPADVVSLRYFILGFLAQEPMSGYDIKRLLRGLNWLIGSPSGGSLYPVLHALLQEQLLTVEPVPGLDRPPRKVYSITGAGRQALRTWVEQPVTGTVPLKAFVMRLLLADSHSHPRLIAHLQQRRAQVAAQHAALLEGTAAPEVSPSLGRRLALDYGLALATAELDWLDRTPKWLSEQWLLEEEAESDSAASAR